MEYKARRPYDLLKATDLPFVATERLALDQLLGRDVSHIDSYVAYIPSTHVNQWNQYVVDAGADPTDKLPNLRFLIRENFSDFVGENGVVPIDVLASDLVRMAPRYLSWCFDEIEKLSPDLASKILAITSRESLGLPSNS